jgi:putative transcriptional regulator
MRSDTDPGRPPPPPSHPLPDEALLEYVSGAASEPAALAMACHVWLCPICAAQVSTLETVGGGLLGASAGQELAAGALEATLARLDAPPQSRSEALAVVEPPPFVAPFDLPRPLLRRLGEAGVGRDFHFVVPGVRAVELPAGAPGATVRLIAFKGGVTIPLHDHGGPEHVVVFTGALEEEGQRFTRGDISIRTPGERHQQRVARGEPCVALVVNQGKLQPLTLRGRLLLALSRG